MDIGSIMLITSLGVLVCILLSRPFFLLPAGGSDLYIRKAVESDEHQRSYLLAEKERIITAIRELDFDNLLGKIPPEDYSMQRMELLQMGAEVLRKLDDLEGKSPDQEAGQRIEDVVKEGRTDLKGIDSLSLEENDELEEMIAVHRNSRKEKAAGFCPGCGKPIHKSDKFCPRCGKAI